MTPDRVRRLLGEGAIDMDALLDGTVSAARTRSAQVAALPEKEVRRHVQALVEASVRALAHGVLADADLVAAERLGADRASQGVPVAALLDGFQAGRTHLVKVLVERGRAAGLPADDLLDAVTSIDEISTALEHRMVHAHRLTELELVRTARDSTAQRLRALLHGEPVDHPLDQGRRYHCLVSEVSEPELARPLEAVLSRSGLTGMVDGRLTAVLSRLPDLQAVQPQPLLVASPAVVPELLPEMYDLSRRAASAALASQNPPAGLQPLTELALVTALAASPELGRLLMAEHLAPALDPEEPFHRDLAETALAYLDNGARVDPTAAALHVHPNTVKYRIRRFQQLTGGRLGGGTVSETTHWWWALRTWLAT